MKKKSKGAGGNLSRSEIVQARLSPKSRFAAEIMAREHRRTLSSLIEIIVEQAIDEETVMCHSPKFGVNSSAREPRYLIDVVEDIWYLDPPMQFITKAFTLPNSLNAEEQTLFRTILNSSYFWKYDAYPKTDITQNSIKIIYSPRHDIDGLIQNHLLEYWDKLIADDLTEQDRISLNSMGEVLSDDRELVIEVREFDRVTSMTVMEKCFTHFLERLGSLQTD